MVDTNDADDVMAHIGRALELGAAGDRTAARATLMALWDRIGEDGDALHRCTVAHHLADLQDAVADEVAWDRRALAVVADLSDERLRRHHSSLRVRAFLPSLHLNLADAYRRAGDVARAREHLALAAPLAAELPDDGYGTMIRDAVTRVTARLDAGSQEPLAAS
ncbi:hypothetical protein [Micromonospora echinofusca]